MSCVRMNVNYENVVSNWIVVVAGEWSEILFLFRNSKISSDLSFDKFRERQNNMKYNNIFIELSCDVCVWEWVNTKCSVYSIFPFKFALFKRSIVTFSRTQNKPHRTTIRGMLSKMHFPSIYVIRRDFEMNLSFSSFLNTPWRWVGLRVVWWFLVCFRFQFTSN